MGRNRVGTGASKLAQEEEQLQVRAQKSCIAFVGETDKNPLRAVSPELQL
jgi:hypothetical protein